MLWESPPCSLGAQAKSWSAVKSQVALEALRGLAVRFYWIKTLKKDPYTHSKWSTVLNVQTGGVVWGRDSPADPLFKSRNKLH
jgi:hypothetical protein